MVEAETFFSLSLSFKKRRVRSQPQLHACEVNPHMQMHAALCCIIS